MKANQSFRNADEAVSPVIGVILMVAITVVLAAVVFVLVSDLGGDTENTPTMSFDKNEGADTLTVVGASEADWADIFVRVSNKECTASLNGTAFIDATKTTGSPPTASVVAGDVLSFVDDTNNDCTVTLTYSPSNSLIGSWTFTL